LRDSALEEYLKTVDLHSVLHELGAQNIDFHLEAIRHFTKEEAEKRDKIVLGYFGEDGVKQIVDAIVKSLSFPPNALILDIGAGSGFFTTKVADRLKSLPNASFYAMDVTPAMLLALIRKTDRIIPFLGLSENIMGSIENAKKYADVPEQFDAVFSTLMLHHCADVDRVFQSLRRVLKSSGKAVIVDLCTHVFTEFKEEMGDLHLGFDPEQIGQAGKKVFSTVSVEKMPGICCESSGRSAELFIATLEP